MVLKEQTPRFRIWCLLQRSELTAVTLLGITSIRNPEFANALSPISVTVSGMSILSNDSQFKNADAPIEVNFVGNSIDVSL